MLKFLTKTSTDAAPAERKIKWLHVVKRPGTTALIDTPREAKPGSFITHVVHNKVMLMNMPVEGKLTVQLLTTDRRSVVVNAADCGPPFSSVVKVTSDFNEAGRLANLCHLVGCASILLPWTSFWIGHKLSAKAFGKQRDSTPQPAPAKKRGRPVGSKDTRDRQPKTVKVGWNYGGKKGHAGMQFCTIGQLCVHDRFGEGYIVQQPNPTSLLLQFGDGEEVTLTTVDAKDVQGTTAATVHEVVQGAAGSSHAAHTPLKRRAGLTRSRSIVQEPTSATHKRVSKADILVIQKRKKREATAARRGTPLKPARLQQNKQWDPALKQQAVGMYNSTYATSKNFEGCTKELLKLPGFEGLKRAHVRNWVTAASKQAAQEPNEFGLVVYEQGRPPALPKLMYNELKEQLIALAKSKAFTLNSTALRPIALAFIRIKLGPEAIRPGRSRFNCSNNWLSRLAHAADLKFRKPFGDARKTPLDAAEQIQDMRLRLAYLMHEHDVPPTLTINFDHTGLHFMQMRGNTWTVVEEDIGTVHASRPGKQKEVKQQNKGDKRQATGTVGSSMGGDVLPGQLLFEGVPHGKGALPALEGNKYMGGSGAHPGHKIGFNLTQAGSDANIGRLTRTWLGHLAQTPNHWANIQTSYGILEFIIVPWLLAKKAAIGKAPDAVCILIVDCWYGWKDQDKMKTLITFRHYVREHYPWLRLLFVPAACTDLAQPADRGQVSWLKANMRAYYTTIISTEVFRQMSEGADLSKLKIDTSAPFMKQMLAISFAKALSEHPSEKVVACWQPLQAAWDNRVALHAQAKAEYARLFPNHVVDVGPVETEPEPSPYITDGTGDDFEGYDAAEDRDVEAHAHLFN